MLGKYMKTHQTESSSGENAFSSSTAACALPLQYLHTSSKSQTKRHGYNTSQLTVIMTAIKCALKHEMTQVWLWLGYRLKNRQEQHTDNTSY